ncbi:MAG: hypothetical protein JNJ46_11725 [Myxococcales bacterium]|nr:hypothetical protein [Myxococcales bacterium]
MCCFSRPVTSVSSTKIFARDAGEGRQFLVYSMNYQAAEDLAMVLPLPVAVPAKEDAVRFVDLHGYADFFSDLHAGFPQPRASRGIGFLSRSASAPAPLAVVQVGSFEASFVPRMQDFARLDARFRLPDAMWSKLPAYQRFGFAVFKLKKSATSVHPMAFSFPRADGSKLFFPTVHIHDGEIHDRAHFDHALYCQVGSEHHRVSEWKESTQPAKSFMRMAESKNLIDGAAHCYLRELVGTRKNEDIYV